MKSPVSPSQAAAPIAPTRVLRSPRPVALPLQPASSPRAGQPTSTGLRATAPVPPTGDGASARRRCCRAARGRSPTDPPAARVQDVPLPASCQPSREREGEGRRPPDRPSGSAHRSRRPPTAPQLDRPCRRWPTPPARDQPSSAPSQSVVALRAGHSDRPCTPATRSPAAEITLSATPSPPARPRRRRGTRSTGSGRGAPRVAGRRRALPRPSTMRTESRPATTSSTSIAGPVPRGRPPR